MATLSFRLIRWVAPSRISYPFDKACISLQSIPSPRQSIQ